MVIFRTNLYARTFIEISKDHVSTTFFYKPASADKEPGDKKKKS